MRALTFSHKITLEEVPALNATLAEQPAQTTTQNGSSERNFNGRK
jgi:hypothetical protein